MFVRKLRHVNFTYAGRVSDVVHQHPSDVDAGPIGDPLRAVSAIGRSPRDTRNPLMHPGPDYREGFYLEELAVLNENRQAAPTVQNGGSDARGNGTLLWRHLLVAVAFAFTGLWVV